VCRETPSLLWMVGFSFYLRIENAEGYVLIAIYLFIYLYACYSHNTKYKTESHEIWWDDFGINRVKGQGHEKVNIFFLP